MLRLRPLRADDEAAFRAGHAAMAAEGHVFGLGYSADMAWDVYLKAREDHRAGRGVRGRFVPSTFLVAEVNGEIVGRTSIRHQLNEFLLREGGHIGYSVLPAHRRRGYATEILRQSLIIARSIGIDRVLVTCDNDNAGSIKAIEANGGKLDSVIVLETFPAGVRRYWID
ncbi:MAG TPA: GNAT family N-acetyltransferase [Streptosporangiaceae bacterium]|jgi:predicted acetyltransferase|nr:GNAT family N-acetyltransferase [Streptosporangiaceae bacterium]